MPGQAAISQNLSLHIYRREKEALQFPRYIKSGGTTAKAFCPLPRCLFQTGAAGPAPQDTTAP